MDLFAQVGGIYYCALEKDHFPFNQINLQDLLFILFPNYPKRIVIFDPVHNLFEGFAMFYSPSLHPSHYSQYQKDISMDIEILWRWFFYGCKESNRWIEQRLGVNLQIADKCLVVRENIEEHCIAILIVSGIILALMSAVGIMRILNNKIKKFNSPLLSVKEITHDTKIFTFGLPDSWKELPLKVGQHLTLTANINGKQVSRKYTPISRSDIKRNSFDLLIKVYELGLMSTYVNEMKIGQKIKVALPYGRFNYLGRSIVRITELNGSFSIQKYNHIYLIGGGTGITPLYQIIQYVCEVETAEPQAAPKLTLLFANRTEKDILLKGQLEDFEISNPNFKCHFSVDKAETESWNGFTGYIDEKKIQATLPEDISNTIFAACGPPIMVNLVQKILTAKFNIPQNRFFRF